MAGSSYFILLDIESAYWHIPIHQDNKDKMGFITPFGSFRYKRSAYGLVGAPRNFQKIMDVTIMGLKDIFALVYLDDNFPPGTQSKSMPGELKWYLTELDRQIKFGKMYFHWWRSCLLRPCHECIRNVTRYEYGESYKDIYITMEYPEYSSLSGIGWLL